MNPLSQACRGPRAANRQVVILLGFTVPFLLLAKAAGSSPEIPGAQQTQPVALINAVIHPVSGPAFQGVLVFDQGKITALGPEVAIPADAQQIDLEGKHVYPGLIDAMSDIGLVEISAVRATVDQSETGSLNPNVQAQLAVNPDSELIPVARSNGVLVMLTAPSGGLLRGRSALLQMDGWTWEDMTLKADVGMHVNWPSLPPVVEFGEAPRGRGRRGRGGDEDSSPRDPLAPLKEFLEATRAYQRARAANPQTPKDIRFESMLPVLDGRLPLYVHADAAAEIQSAVAFTQREKLKMVLYGGYDAPLCAALLKSAKVPVIVGGVYRLPRRRDAAFDEAYTVPHRLHQAGVAYCIAGAGEAGASNARNLPYHAAVAAAYGLPQDEALRAITLNAAKILGVADQIGSLEVGKDATLFVATGDPLETESNTTLAFIQGRKVDLSDRHKRLYHKYEEKYRRLQQ